MAGWRACFSSLKEEVVGTLVVAGKRCEYASVDAGAHARE